MVEVAPLQQYERGFEPRYDPISAPCHFFFQKVYLYPLQKILIKSERSFPRKGILPFKKKKNDREITICDQWFLF